jgi:outer membrane murein-binding lipoprotein Lpp
MRRRVSKREILSRLEAVEKLLAQRPRRLPGRSVRHRVRGAPGRPPCRAGWTAVTTDSTAPDETPKDDSAPTEAERLEALADQLSREYDYRSLVELEQEDPERAQEHRDAARTLLPWITECPREERQAAFGRGYEKGRERQQARTAADVRRLEAEVAELRTDRDPEGLRARIRDLEYALEGWDRFMTGRVRAGAAPDWEQQAAEYLAKLTAVQRELAVLKGVQPGNATRRAAT